MIRRHNKVVDVVRKAIEEHMVNRFHSGIGENTTMVRQSLTEETRRLRPNLNFVANTFVTRFAAMIDISCPTGRISYGENTSQKMYVDKLEKSMMLARDVKAEREMSVEIIPVIVSPLGAVHEQLLKDLSILFMCREK
jgi:hypothetical protein